MSLDFDRSSDGEPTAPADKTPVPAQQAPATTDPAFGPGPSFTPAPVPADDESAAGEPEPAADEAGDKPAIGKHAAPGGASSEVTDDEPEPEADDHAATEPTAGEPTAGEPSTYSPTTYERAADEPEDDEPEDDEAEPAAGEPATSETAASETPAAEPVNAGPAAGEAAGGEPTASEVTAYRSSAAPAWDGARTADGSADRAGGRTAGIGPAADLDGPLISDADELRTSWQRIQAEFVDDPREAVADAAGLVEHTAQALTGALRQRQQQLRAMWDRDGMPDGVEYADSGGAAPGATSPDGGRQAADDPGTEQLRLLIQRYRALFNHLCRP